jgi:hypothetical protein
MKAWFVWMARDWNSAACNKSMWIRSRIKCSLLMTLYDSRVWFEHEIESNPMYRCQTQTYVRHKTRLQTEMSVLHRVESPNPKWEICEKHFLGVTEIFLIKLLSQTVHRTGLFSLQFTQFRLNMHGETILEDNIHTMEI